MQVQDRGEVQSAFTGADVGDVGKPDLAPRAGGEVASEPVWGDGVSVRHLRHLGAGRKALGDDPNAKTE